MTRSIEQEHTAADAVADRLREAGVDYVFGLPGDDMALMVALESRGIELVLAKDQRNAIYRAVAYARVSGRMGVCLIGKGPAITHAASGILEALSSRVPVLILTSGTPADELGTGRFQELDALEVLQPLVKWSVRVRPHTIALDLDRAIAEVTEAPRGPVLVEIPEGLSLGPAAQTGKIAVIPGADRPATSGDEGVLALFRQSKRPVVLVGGGAHAVGDLVMTFLERMQAAGVCTASGRGILAEEHSQFLGLAGLYFPAETKELLRSADLVIALGSRLEETATFGWEEVLDTVPVVQVLDHPGEFFAPRSVYRVVGDAGTVLQRWLSALGNTQMEGRTEWLARVLATRNAVLKRASAPHSRASGGVAVAEVLAELDSVLPTARLSVHENGLQDMWSYQFPYWIVRGDASCLVPSEQTPLGFGMAGALGAALADERPVVVIGGDGAFGAVGPDLAAFADCRSAMLVVVLSNGGFGWLEMNLRQLNGTAGRFTAPSDAVRSLCEAFRIDYVKCEETGELKDRVAHAWRVAATGRAVVLDVLVSLHDAPPGMELLAGDFPLALTTSGSA